MVKKLFKYAETIIDDKKGVVTVIIDTKKLARSQIAACTVSTSKGEMSSILLGAYIDEKRPVFIGKAKLKDGDESNIELATRIARTKLERQIDKFALQIYVKLAINSYKESKAAFLAAVRYNKAANHCTAHIIDLQLPKDHGPVDIDTSESQSMTAKKLLNQHGWLNYTDFIELVEEDVDERRYRKSRLKEEKRKAKEANS